MIIIDNLLSPSVFKLVTDIVESNTFPWYYSKTTYQHTDINTDKPTTFNFTNYPLDNSQKHTPFASTLEPLLFAAIEQTGAQVDEIFRIRVAMQTKIDKIYTNDPHIDMPFPHTAAILYLTDSTAPTKIYNETYDFHTDFSKYKDFSDASYGYFMEKYSGVSTVAKEVEAKANRFVCFDGAHYHSSSSPTDEDRRIIINFDFSTRA